MLPQRYHKIRQILDRRQLDLTVILENVHKPHNLSAIVRTCDAVGVFEMHAVNQGEVPTFSQVAQGSEKWVNLTTHSAITSTIQQLQQQGFQVLAAHLSDAAIDYRLVDYTLPTAILLGAEKWGVSQTAADEVDKHIIIPMMGMVQSLNVSVAAAVILFEAQRQRLAADMYSKVQLDPQTYHHTLFEWGYPKVAQMYRNRQQPYPALGEQGEIIG